MDWQCTSAQPNFPMGRKVTVNCLSRRFLSLKKEVLASLCTRLLHCSWSLQSSVGKTWEEPSFKDRSQTLMEISYSSFWCFSQGKVCLQVDTSLESDLFTTTLSSSQWIPLCKLSPPTSNRTPLCHSCSQYSQIVSQHLWQPGIHSISH